MLTYAGIFDDQVFRYPGSASEVVCREAPLNETLLRCLYVGRPLAINDGYLLQNEFLIKWILDKNSFFREMARNGYIVLLRRTDGPLSKVVDWAKENCVSTLANLEKTDSRWESLANKLDEFEDEVKLSDFNTYGSVPDKIKRWAKRDTGAAYIKTMRHLLVNDLFHPNLVDTFEYQDIKSAFLIYADKPEKYAPRTFWEKTVKEVYHRNPNIPVISDVYGKKFMEIANCVYHFNYAAVFEAENEPMNVSTPMDSTFLNFALQDSAEGDLPRDIPKVKIPKNLYEVDSEIAKDFMQNHDLMEAKDSYLQSVEHYASTLQDYGRIEDAADKYSKLLNDFQRPEACNVLAPKTWITLTTCSLSGIGAGLEPPLNIAVPATTIVTGVIATFGEPVLHRIIRNVTSKKVSPPILDNNQIPRCRQVQLQPAGQFYSSLVQEITNDLDEIYA